ncbi:MAG: class I SAM-dependent methyltransferase [Candidatus Margulisiibacteriota bacterium]|nr:class I SAM-dependent methyltransferase [Candidatus Margulisiibacteriota bacterium]
MANIPCKICSNTTAIIYDGQYDQNYYYCNNCDFIFLDENKILSPDQEKKEYSFHQNNFENEGYVNMFREFIDKAINPHKAKIKTALDFGSGPGPVLAELLRKEGFKTDVYDKYFAPEKVYLDKKYDLITATEVFEHLKDPLETLKLLKSLLNKDGIIAITTLFHPNNDEEFKKWWYRRDSTHIAFYTPKTIERIARLVGMKVLMADEKNTITLGDRDFSQ